jgi:hypothetical protein
LACRAGQAVDLVEKDGPAAGMFELAEARPGRAGKGAASWPKSSLSIRLGGQGGAVDLHEGTVGAFPGLVQRAGGKFLAGARGALDQDIGLGRGHGAQLPAQGAHRRRSGQQARRDRVGLRPPVCTAARSARFSSVRRRFSSARRTVSTSRAGA